MRCATCSHGTAPERVRDGRRSTFRQHGVTRGEPVLLCPRGRRRGAPATRNVAVRVIDAQAPAVQWERAQRQQRERTGHIQVNCTTVTQDLLAAARLRAEAFYEDYNGPFRASYIDTFASDEYWSLTQRTRGTDDSCVCVCIVAKAAMGCCSTGPKGTADLVPPAVYTGVQPRAVPADDRRGALVCNLTVGAADRRRGIARALMQYAAQQARQLQAERLYAQVEVDNLGAITLYKQLGMEQVGMGQRVQRAGKPRFMMTMVLDLIFW